uniref:PD-(D/E)XK nuclease-like domain-containing protein n=1 Tax=Geobacter sp. (strain M21) TaxID=443144 RepID=C6DZD7_GEOSM
MSEEEIFGDIFTTCKKSYRGKAERRQREYRVQDLNVGWSGYGHWLDAESSAAGKNFVLPMCHAAARSRDGQGKGVGDRTFTNMLSSQAMCFNIFEPLNQDKELCRRVLNEFIPGLVEVRSVSIEYTPDNGIFQDQSARGGVDCDVLIEAFGAGDDAVVIVIETKFVEPEFSVCGYKKAGRKVVCPDDVPVKQAADSCLYAKKKPSYLYWQRTLEHDFLKDDAVHEAGCPFAGPSWQMWVNYALAHEEARRRGATKAYYAVCASSQNTRLLKLKHNTLDYFRSLVKEPETVVMIDIDALFEAIGNHIDSGDADHQQWLSGLKGRYGQIA